MNKITRRNVLAGLAAVPLIAVAKPIGATSLPKIYDEHEAYRYITSRFREGPSTSGPYAVTNECYTEIGVNGHKVKARTKNAVWDKFWYAFDDYAEEKNPKSFVFFRIPIEYCSYNCDGGKWHRIYCRLLISDSKWSTELADWNNRIRRLNAPHKNLQTPT